MSVVRVQLLAGQWSKALAAALDADTWGQALEAEEGYEKLARVIDGQLSASAEFSIDERSILRKVVEAVTLRAQALQDTRGERLLPLAEVKKLQQVLANVFSGMKVADFPVALAQYGRPGGGGGGNGSSNSGGGSGSGAIGGAARGSNSASANWGGYGLPGAAAAAARSSSAKAGGEQVTLRDEDKELGGTLLPPPKPLRTGVTLLSVLIERIGLKDAQTYIDSRVTVSLVDPRGMVIGPQQDTPISQNLRPLYVEFGRLVHLQTPVEEMDKGWAVFFEFKHYKPQKKKISTRCFAFFEHDEIMAAQRDNKKEVALELYKKPTDFEKRRLTLFSVKPLYLHLQLIFQRV